MEKCFGESKYIYIFIIYIYEVLLGEIIFHGVKALTEGWEGGSVNRCLSMHKAFGACPAQFLHQLGVAQDCTLSTQTAGAEVKGFKVSLGY